MVLRIGPQIREIAAPTARHQYFKSGFAPLLQNHGLQSAATGVNRAHQAARASTHNQNITFPVGVVILDYADHSFQIGVHRSGSALARPSSAHG